MSADGRSGDAGRVSADGGRPSGATVRLDVDGTVDAGAFRPLALASVLVLTASYVSVLHGVTSVVGGTRWLALLVVAALCSATVLARTIRPLTATVLAVAAGAVGFAYYFDAAGVGLDVVVSATDEVLADAVTLATGHPLLQMIEAGVWALAFVPAPVFLSWYLAVRGRYGASALSGGLALCFLVLTGDAGTTVTLVGTLAALAAVGFGDLSRRGGSFDQVDLLAVVLAAVVVLSLWVTVLPGGRADAVTMAGGGEGTLEGTIDAAPDRSGIAGSVDLSPEPRFTVEADRPSYWRTGVYDRFTGDEWVRSGQQRTLDGRLADPPGRYDRVEQTVTAESDLAVAPVAPHPLSVDEFPGDPTVSSHGQVHPGSVLSAGESYTVESAAITADPADLRLAGTEYPDEVTATYLQRPESPSSAFAERTAEITADAETPYETAAAVEEHLRTSKGYSLSVERPDGDVAEAFLLEMDEGYCVYFATTMVQMLRAEDVPARYVTGYTTGERVDDDTYVVRGLDAHAWVEVYFPGHGWVSFDPTPPGDRDAVHGDRLEDSQGEPPQAPDADPAADPDDPAPDPADDPEEPPEGANGTDDDPGDGDPPPESDPGSAPGDSGGGDGTAVPVSLSRESVGLAAVVLVGLVAGVRRTGAGSRARRLVGTYWQRRTGDPDRDVERAFRRLERLLAREYRPRRRGETARDFCRSLAAGASTPEAVDDGSVDAEGDGESPPLARDPRVADVREWYERAVYGDGVDRETADRAIETVDALARERTPVVGRRWR